jgi:hypothetical protein
VVHVHSSAVTSWNGSNSDYWNYIDQGVVDEMMDQGLMAMTGTSSITNAWRALLPSYQVGEGIAIKVSFNNTFGCDENSGAIDGVIEPVNAIVRGLKQIGVAESDIWVYEATRALPVRFVGGCLFDGIKFFDNGCNLNAGWSSQDPYALVSFSTPSGVPTVEPHRITDVVINATYLINLPIMKLHSFTGWSCAFKNHYGTTVIPSNLHPYSSLKGDYYTADYSPFIDIYKNPHIGGKTILTVADGLFSAFNRHFPPGVWETFGNDYPKSFLFSTDPVAIDCVMGDLLTIEKPNKVDSRAGDYLILAANAGLGVHERGDPWGSGYSSIDYHKMELDSL